MTVLRDQHMEKVVALTKRRGFEMSSPRSGEARIKSRPFLGAREGAPRT